jgi:hypothetical protein
VVSAAASVLIGGAGYSERGAPLPAMIGQEVTRSTLHDQVVQALGSAVDPEQRIRLAEHLFFARAELRARPPSPELRALVRELFDLEEVVRLAGPAQSGWTMRQPGFEGVHSLQTGDVILVRGAPTTPVLAEVTEVSAGAAQSPYSHTIVAARDPKTGAVNLIESQEPHGFREGPAQEALLSEYARVVVLRLREPAARQEAGQRLTKELPELRRQGHVPYNSWLDDDDPHRLNCGQLARRLLGPQYPAERTTLDDGMANYARRAGMKATTMVLPGDFERDGRFEIVAEGSNPTLLREVRLREAATLAVFRRQSAGLPVLEPSPVALRLEAATRWLLSLGVVAELNDRVVGAAIDLRRVTHTAVAALGLLRAAHADTQGGRPPTAREMARHLDDGQSR